MSNTNELLNILTRGGVDGAVRLKQSQVWKASQAFSRNAKGFLGFHLGIKYILTGIYFESYFECENFYPAVIFPL